MYPQDLFLNAGTLWKPSVMKKLYTFSILLLVLFLNNSCSKDILKAYEDRIIGTWELEDVNRVGFGGDSGNLPFRHGVFVFSNNGALTYTEPGGAVYSGSWDIERATYEDRVVRSMHITAVNFATQEVRSEFFEEINFTGTNKFKAYIRQGLHTWLFHFAR